MRFAAILLASVLVFPIAAAENGRGPAVGATLTTERGVAGFGLEDAGFGVRYWDNSTRNGTTDATVTACYLSDSGLVAFCERLRVSA